VYVCAAAGLAGLLGVLWRWLPAGTGPGASLSYGRLLGSMWTLWRSEPVLREACLFGAMTFGAFSAFWMTLAFHMATPPLHYGSQAVGMMGLFALAGALTAAGAGRLADRYGARPISGVFLGVTAGSFVVLWALRHSLWGMGLGVVLMDLGIQGVHVSNQARVYALSAAARNRLGAIYIVTYFAGGSLGSGLGVWAWGRSGWLGVCVVGGGMVLAAVASFVVRRGVPGGGDVREDVVAVGAVGACEG
jgi:predicted MFS family arabinose efflux permease